MRIHVFIYTPTKRVIRVDKIFVSKFAEPKNKSGLGDEEYAMFRHYIYVQSSNHVRSFHE